MIKVNSAGVSFAKAQIKAGNYTTGGSWSFTGEDGNKLLGDNEDWANYGKHHLGIDTDADKGTKAYYKYPFAKSDGVHRKGLIAAKQRAAQQGETDIEDAATELIDMIDKKEGSGKSMSDMLVTFGTEVKSLGDGLVGGYLVLFGSPEKSDLTKDYFDANTDFDVDFSGEVKSTVYYNHGLDPTLGKKKLGGGVKATLGIDDVGVWIKAQLDERDEYESAILKLVGKKQLGWSSGTASHIVEREEIKGAFHIKRWPLGIDASLTPTPAESRNVAAPIKSISFPSFKALTTGQPDLMDDDSEDSMLGTNVFEELTINALYNLWNMFGCQGLWQIIYNDLISNDEKLSRIDAGFDQLSAKGKAVARAIMALDLDEMSDQYGTAKSLFFKAPEEQKFSSFRQQLEYAKSVMLAVEKRAEAIKENFDSTKTGAMFNAKNREYLQSLGGELVMHGNTLMDLVTATSSDDNGKSISALELRLAERTYQHNSILKP